MQFTETVHCYEGRKKAFKKLCNFKSGLCDCAGSTVLPNFVITTCNHFLLPLYLSVCKSLAYLNEYTFVKSNLFASCIELYPECK